MLQNSSFSHFLQNTIVLPQQDMHTPESELMLQTADDGKEVKKAIADRAINPTVSDYSRLYGTCKWRIEEMGAENGANMFLNLRLK